MPPITIRSPRRSVVASGALLTALLVGPVAAVAATPALASGTAPTTPTAVASSATTMLSAAATAAPSGTAPAASITASATSATASHSSTPPSASPTPPQQPLAVLPTGTPVERAAAYLVTNLTDGDHVVGAFGTDLGQTADVVLALSSTTSQDAARDAAADFLAAHVDDYVHGAAFADGSAGGEKAGANYAGPTGKAVVAALAAGQDPRSFGGFDLVSELQGLMVTSGAKAGRFADDSAFGDYSNPVGQAFDIIALRRTTGAVPDAAVAYLLTAQCADGGFPDAYPTSPKSCASNPDSTGLALQALVAAGVTDSTADASCAAGKALAWLRAHDAANGSYASGAVDPSSKPAANVNSTAYAALGLTAAAAGTAAQVTYLASVQNADGGLPILPTSDDTSSNVLATAQALNALTGSTFLSLGDSPVAAAKPACTVTASPTTTATSRPTPSTRTTAPHSTAPAGRSTVAAGAAGRLPRTGADPFGPGLLGLALVLVGGAVVAGTRRPRGARQ